MGGELIAFTRSAPPQEALWPLCAIVAMCCLLLLKCEGLKCATRRPRRKEERSPPCCRPTPREVTGRIQFEEASVCGAEKNGWRGRKTPRRRSVNKSPQYTSPQYSSNLPKQERQLWAKYGGERSIMLRRSFSKRAPLDGSATHACAHTPLPLHHVA